MWLIRTQWVQWHQYPLCSKYHFKKTYMRAKVKLHAFLTSTLDWSRLHDPLYSVTDLPPKGKSPSIYLTTPASQCSQVVIKPRSSTPKLVFLLSVSLIRRQFNIYCGCRSKFKVSSLVESRRHLKYYMSFPVICTLETSLLEIGKVRWLEKRKKSDMKVVLVTGERSSISQDAPLVYRPLRSSSTLLFLRWQE
jgi:hypothetical protein